MEREKLPSLRVFGVVSLVVIIAGFLVAAKPAVQGESFDTCAECHEDTAKLFLLKPHATMKSCTICHSDSEKHLEEGGGPTIFAFKETDHPTEKTDVCLTCHAKSNARFPASPHGRAALDCTSCHSMHTSTKPSYLKTNATKSCFSCHQDVFSLFQLNERHRLQEGILECTSCHDPHAPSARERLGGFKHQSCIRCHTDKGGPFLYEHLSSRIEGCTSCHEVHGSPNRRLLTHQSISDLCFSCHTVAPSWHSRFDSVTTNCVTCHTTIHGSNLNKFFLK
jgi:DmsE family decaheme c-type cytochrome